MPEENFDPQLFTSQTVTSKDGATIGYYTIGKGPGILVLPGALAVAADYRELSKALADRFTVHIIERRGRGHSSPMGSTYSMDRECEDVTAVQKATQATFMFGQSYGGLIALEAARNNSAFKKIAVYEPGVSINGSIPVSWIEPYKKQVANKKYFDALAEFVVGVTPGLAGKQPKWLLKFILPMIFKGQKRQQTFDLLEANAKEHTEVGRLDNSYKNYHEISAGVLLAYGGKSHKSVAQTAKALSEVIPNSEAKALPGLDHFAPDEKAPAEVAKALEEYFLK